MKTILTITFVLFIGMAAQAQDAKMDTAVVTVEMTPTTSTSQKVKLGTKTEVARLYKFKNSKIKKALSFTTKRNKPKMA